MHAFACSAYFSRVAVCWLKRGLTCLRLLVELLNEVG